MEDDGQQFVSNFPWEFEPTHPADKADIKLRQQHSVRLVALNDQTRPDTHESSPAMTLAQMIRANRRAFAPGSAILAPATPNKSSIAFCGPRMVPPCAKRK